MIMSFSVPDNPKYVNLINWYKSQDSQERSRNFREIFMAYLEKPHHTIETQATNHISLPQEMPKIERRITAREEPEIDLDSKFASIGIRG